MKHLKFLLAALAMPLIAQAADVVPNHIRHPLHPAPVTTVLRAAVAEKPLYVPTLAQGGLSSQNKVVGSDGTPFLDDLWRYADSSVQQADVDTAGGVAALGTDKALHYDLNGSISGPSGVFVTDFRVAPVPGRSFKNTTNNGVQLPGYAFWWGNQIGLGSYQEGDHQTIVGDWWITPPETLHLGGQSENSSGFLNVHCNPYGSSNAGTCAQFMMGGANIQAMAAGIGPSASDHIANYDNFDAATVTVQAGGSTPHMVITSANATNVFPPMSDGLDHTPTFTASGATFANPLPYPETNWLMAHQQNLHLMTNEIGCATCNIQTYAATMTGVQTNAAGQATGITVNGWRIFSSGDDDGNQIPGQTTTDGSKPALDTVWSNFGHPAIMVGIWTKAFNMYSLCGVGNPAAGSTMGDINNPSGGRNNQLRVCEGWEMDLWNSDSTPEHARIHGITAAYSQRDGGTRPSADSYDFNAAGANSISYLQSGEYFTMPFSGSNFVVDSYEGPQYAKGSIKSLFQVSQSERIGYEADGGWPRNNVMFGAWTSRNAAVGCDGCADPNGSADTETLHLGEQVTWYGAKTRDKYGNPTWTDPQYAQIELNAPSNKRGINLCSGSQDDTTCMLQVGPDWAALAGRLTLKGPIDLTQNPSGSAIKTNAQFATIYTGSADGNNGAIEIKYDPETNALLFTNNHYGNTYKFTGTVSADQLSAALAVVGGLRIPTGSPDSNNSSIEVKYDLASNTMLFTNNHAGNNYRFDGQLSASAGLDGSNGLRLPATAPASSSVACTAGQIRADGNYLYVCTAPNTWRRSALSDF